jgi:hypothetical protein
MRNHRQNFNSFCSRRLWLLGTVSLVALSFASPLCLLREAALPPRAAALSHDDHHGANRHHDDDHQHPDKDDCCITSPAPVMTVAAAAPAFKFAAPAKVSFPPVATLTARNALSKLVIVRRGRDGPARSVRVLAFHSSSLFSRPPPAL